MHLVYELEARASVQYDRVNRKLDLRRVRFERRDYFKFSVTNRDFLIKSFGIHMLPESVLASSRTHRRLVKIVAPGRESHGERTSNLQSSIVTRRSHLSEIFHVTKLAGHPTGSRHCLFAWFLPMIRVCHDTT